MRYQGRKAKSFVDWDRIDYVVGTRDDVTQTGIRRPCQRCRHDVYTSRSYPDRVAMICEVCALAMAQEEAAAGRATLPISRPGAHALAGPTDPWQRLAAASPPPRDGLLPSRRRARPRSGEH